MNEVSETTTSALKPIVKALYDCLFDPTKRFTSLAGFESVIDNGIVKFHGNENSRHIKLKYDGNNYDLGIFNYIRDNGSTLGIKNGSNGSNLIQYVLDKFIQVSDNKIIFSHDGVTTGSKGKTKDDCIRTVAKDAPHLIQLKDNNYSINLGYLKNGFQFEDKSFQTFVANFIEYTILRNNFKIESPHKINLREKFYSFLCTIRNRNNERESIYNFEADKAKFTTIIEKVSKYFTYDLFKINDDYSDVSSILKKVEKDFKILYTTNEEYISYNSETENGIPNSIIGTHYLDFLRLLKNNKTIMTFPQLVENLRFNFIEKDLIFKILSHKPKQMYVWIADGKGLIGNITAHYEVICKENRVFVDIHFEGKKKLKDIFYNSITELPQNLEWIDWQNSKSIRYSDNFNLNELDLVEKTTSALEYMEHNIGDQIRQIIKGLSPAYGNLHDNEDKINEIVAPLNQILYGPPGTGKTYHTVLEAAKIISAREITNYDEALKIFNDNLGGQIEFITFHQNYSYEDFIQGLRPDVENGSALTFHKKDGVFKRIADRALENLKLASKNTEEISKEILFDQALENFKESILDTEDKYAINDAVFIFDIDQEAFRYTGANWENHSNGIRMKFSDLKEFYRNNVQSRKDIKSLTTISGLANQHATYYLLVYHAILKFLPSKVQQVAKIEKKNYVIIIDEINRANISRVFGELITLIEPDKRFGGKIPMSVTLPSGDPFMVPDNLYIIGTMNTADKSIALLDIALRRRFEFVPMYPQYNIEGQTVHYPEVLRAINEKIWKLKTRDFQIGHSYFMENSNLEHIMNRKVIPLLLEYFMNDEKTVREIITVSNGTIDTECWPMKFIQN